MRCGPPLVVMPDLIRHPVSLTLESRWIPNVRAVHLRDDLGGFVMPDSIRHPVALSLTPDVIRPRMCVQCGDPALECLNPGSGMTALLSEA